jgi:hypothetical protein
MSMHVPEVTGNRICSFKHIADMACIKIMVLVLHPSLNELEWANSRNT